MDIFQALILGIVEGFTEFLPVSSTGHLMLVSDLLAIPESAFLKSFQIAIQLGAILAVVFLYFKKVWANKDTWKKVFLAFVPTAILGFVFYKIVKEVFLSNTIIVLWSLFLGGIALIIFEIWNKKRSLEPKEIDNKKAVIIGACQALAMVPGVSRSAATIVGGLLMGIKREKIVEFSFLLAVPTMAAATGYDLLKTAGDFSLSQFHLLAIGFVISFFTALISIKWLLNFIKHHTFIVFGVYRIIIAVFFWLIVT